MSHTEPTDTEAPVLPATLHIVTSGSYSDYRIHCICPTQTDAETIAQRANSTAKYTDYETAEIPVHDATVQRIIHLIMRTTIHDNGTETETGETERIEWPFDKSGPEFVWSWNRGSRHKGTGGTLYVYGYDNERVRKTYSDQRAALLSDPAYRQRQHMNGNRP